MLILSRLSGTAGFKEVFAPAKMNALAVDLDRRLPSVAFPANAFDLSKSSIDARPRVTEQPQVAPLVVLSVGVFMVNKVARLLFRMQEPSKALSVIRDAPVSNDAIALAIKTSSGTACFGLAPADKPNKFTRIGPVFQDFTNRIGYKFRSHIALLCGLVRGSVVTATDAPILSRGICL